MGWVVPGEVGVVADGVVADGVVTDGVVTGEVIGVGIGVVTVGEGGVGRALATALMIFMRFVKKALEPSW